MSEKISLDSSGRKNNNEKVYLFDMGYPRFAFHFV